MVYAVEGKKRVVDNGILDIVYRAIDENIEDRNLLRYACAVIRNCLARSGTQVRERRICRSCTDLMPKLICHSLSVREEPFSTLCECFMTFGMIQWSEWCVMEHW